MPKIAWSGAVCNCFTLIVKLLNEMQKQVQSVVFEKAKFTDEISINNFAEKSKGLLRQHRKIMISNCVVDDGTN